MVQARPRLLAGGGYGDPRHGRVESRRQESDRGDGRRRDDPYHLGDRQGAADRAIRGGHARALRPTRRRARPHGRRGHSRSSARDPASQGRGQVRHDHPRRRAREGVPAQASLAEPQWHDPGGARRHGVPQADRGEERATDGALVGEADHDRPPRLWRPLQERRDEDSGPGQGRAGVHAGCRGGAPDHGARVPRAGRGDGDPQSRGLDPFVRPRLHRVRDQRTRLAVVRRQGHDQQDLPRRVQGHLPRRGGSARRRPRARRRDLPVPADRRRGGAHDAPRRRVPVGLHELRRRRDERHDRLGLRKLGAHDLGAGLPGRSLRVRGSARHGAAPLLSAPEGPANVHQLDRHHLRVERSARETRRDGRHPRAGGLRPGAGSLGDRDD